MKHFCLLITLAMFFVGCTSTDMKIEKMSFQSEQYDASGTSLCVSVNVEYVSFSGTDSSAKINDVVKKYAFLGYDSGEKLIESMSKSWDEQVVDTVCVHDEDLASSETEDAFVMSPWYYNCTVECAYLDDKYVSTIMKHSTNSPFVTAIYPEYMTFDSQTGERKTAADVFSSKEEMEAILTEMFIKENNLQEGVPLTEQGIGISTDNIPLTDEFIFSPQRVVFHYSMTQMAPLSQCKDDVKIPFELLEGQIK